MGKEGDLSSVEAVMIKFSQDYFEGHERDAGAKCYCVRDFIGCLFCHFDEGEITSTKQLVISFVEITNRIKLLFLIW